MSLQRTNGSVNAHLRSEIYTNICLTIMSIRIYIYSGPNCYMSCFIAIGSAVPEKKIFEGFLPCMGMAAILVM